MQFHNRLSVLIDFLLHSGLRPLVRDPSAPPGDTKSLSRNHVIVPNPDSGLISILGGKWTTYRRMAEEAVDAAVKMHGLRAGPCKSRELAIVGTEYFRNNHDTDHTIMLRERYAKPLSYLSFHNI